VVVDLARTLPDPPTSAMMRERLPHLAARMSDEALGAMDDDPRYRVMATRHLARRVIAANPDAPQDVVLDASAIEVASGPFLDELLKAWPAATLTGANEDVQDTWRVVLERHAHRNRLV
jgi:hypothetical protein